MEPLSPPAAELEERQQIRQGDIVRGGLERDPPLEQPFPIEMIDRARRSTAADGIDEEQTRGPF
jgi:hypothetical protein